jgi:YfiH family protein
MTLPTPDDSFEWRDHEGRAFLVCRALEPFAPHVFTTSAWALGSRTQDSSRERGGSSLAQAWRQLSDALSLDHRRLVRATQVHGAAVIVGTRAVAEGGFPEADIILLREPDAAAAVQAADCVPMLMVDRASGAVAAAHAGWRGMVARVPHVALRAMATTFGSKPADVIVALGPSIGACCYEVGPDVRDAFASAGFLTSSLEGAFLQQPVLSDINRPLPQVAAAARRADRWFFDGWRMTSDQLVEAGVPRAQIYAARLCTASHPDVLCSYRRDGAPAGRIVGAIRCQPRSYGSFE